MPDLYATLGVDRYASASDIKKSYRKLTQQYHPDKNPGDKRAEETFKALSAAYEALSDPDRRRNYDEFGDISLSIGFDAQAARQAREQERFVESFLRPPPKPRPGADVHQIVEVPFLKALRGGITVPVGSRDELSLRIPRGTTDGKILRLRGKGQPGFPPGDMLVTVIVPPHAHVKLRSPPSDDPATIAGKRLPDLTMRCHFTWLEVYTRGSILVPTPWGTYPVLVYPNHPMLRLDVEYIKIARYGVRCSHTAPCDCVWGDMIVTPVPCAPIAGDPELLRVLRRLQERENPRVELERSMET